MYAEIRDTAIDQHRTRMFGDDVELKLYSTSPSDGDVELISLAAGWRAYRVWETTDIHSRQSGSWQIEISQAAIDAAQGDEPIDMMRVTVGIIDGKRYRLTKVEEPIGESRCWRFRAERQK